MPHIVVDGCDCTRNINRIYLHAEVVFSNEYILTSMPQARLEELKQEMEKIVEKYFPAPENIIYLDHEWDSNFKY